MRFRSAFVFVALAPFVPFALAQDKAPQKFNKPAVSIVVDQLAAWVARERLPQLPKDGGFARLLNGGRWIKDCEFPYAMTETAPGRASLYTGKLPSEHGIVANQVWRGDMTKKQSASLIADEGVGLKTESGSLPGPGVSGRKLAGDTLASALFDGDDEAEVVSISLKDRGAIFAAPWKKGRTRARGVGLVWQDETTGALVTTEPFEFPRWARGVSLFEWAADPQVKDLPQVPDDAPGEEIGMGGSFPHPFFRKPEREDFRRFRATPFGDKLVVDLAINAIDDACRHHDDASEHCALGHRFLLALSLSSNDYVGHRFGPDSVEAWTELFALDRELARLLTHLDRTFGSSGYSVVLSGDHGIGPLPETSRRIPRPAGFELPLLGGPQGERLSDKAVAQELRDALGEARLRTDSIVDVSEALITLGELEPADRIAVRDRVRTELLRRAAVDGVVDLDEDICGKPCPSRGDVMSRVCASTLCDPRTHRSVWGNLYIVPKPGSFFSSDPYKVSHGTPYRYDRTVPLIVKYAAGIETKPGACLSGDSGRFDSFYASLWLALTGTESATIRASPVCASAKVSATKR